MLKDETNTKLQDIAFDIEQALEAIGENPSSYDLGKFEGRMIGLSVMLNRVAADIDAYCEKGEEEMKWVPYDGKKLIGRRVMLYNDESMVARTDARKHIDTATHYLMLPELPKQEEKDAKS